MKQYVISNIDLKYELDFEQLSYVNRMIKKVVINSHNVNYETNELIVISSLNNVEVISYYSFEINSLNFIECSVTKGESFEFLSIIVQEGFKNLFNNIYEVNNKNVTTYLNNSFQQFLSCGYDVLNVNQNQEFKMFFEFDSVIKLRLKVSCNSNFYFVNNLCEFKSHFVNYKQVLYNSALITHKLESFLNSEVLKFILSLIHSDVKSVNLSESDFLKLIENEKLITIDSRSYEIVRINNKSKLSIVKADEFFNVSVINDYDIYNSFSFKLNKQFILNEFKCNLSSALINKLLVEQLISNQQAYDLFCLYESKLKVDFILECDYDFKSIATESCIMYVNKINGGLKLGFDVTANNLVHNKYSLNKLEYLLLEYKLGETYFVKQSEMMSFMNFKLNELRDYVDEIKLDDKLSNLVIINEFDLKIEFKKKKNSLNINLMSSMFSHEQIKKILDSSEQYLEIDEFYINTQDPSIVKIREALNQFSFNNVAHNLILSQELLNGNNVIYDDGCSEIINKIKDFKYKKHDLNQINTHLRNYQYEGVNWLLNLHEFSLPALLADEMGLGKTVQIISFLNNIEYKNVLIVAPASLIYNWKQEINKFSNLDVNLYPELNDICLITYDQLRININKLKSMVFDYIILDEAQRIKNDNTLIYQSIVKIKATNKICLSGTPIENDITDLQSIFNFLIPNYFSDIENIDSEIIKHKIAPFVLRRTKELVMSELPLKNEMMINLDFDDVQRAIYDKQLHEFKEMLVNDSSTFDILSQLTKLRMCCLNPRFVDDKFNSLSIKMNYSINLIKDINSSNQKIIVFSQFVRNLEDLEKLLIESKISYLKITGKTSKQLRQIYVNEFNSSDVCVFLISLKAGNFGLNLTSASNVLLFDPWWNRAVENQAIDRTHRIGQQNTVNVYRLIINQTIEENIIKLQEDKLQTFEEYLNNKDEINVEFKSDLTKILK